MLEPILEPHFANLSLYARALEEVYVVTLCVTGIIL